MKIFCANCKFYCPVGFCKAPENARVVTTYLDEVRIDGLCASLNAQNDCVSFEDKIIPELPPKIPELEVDFNERRSTFINIFRRRSK